MVQFERLIAFGRDHAAKEHEALGDVQERLKRIEAARAEVPRPPDFPYDGEAVTAWVVSLAQTRQIAEQALAALATIGEKAHLPNNPGTVGQGAPYDMQDVGRLNRAHRNTLMRVDASLEQFKRDLDLQVAEVARRHSAQPPAVADSSARQNHYLGKGIAERRRDQLRADRKLVEAALVFDRLLNRAETAEHLSALEQVDRAAAQYESLHAQALAEVRMPPAVSVDEALMTVARETLENPKYGAGPVARMVISTDRQQYEKEMSEDQYDDVDISLSGEVTLSGTRTTYRYAWEQFQVATAEQEDGKYYIFHNTLKRFTAGAPTTPLR